MPALGASNHFSATLGELAEAFMDAAGEVCQDVEEARVLGTVALCEFLSRSSSISSGGPWKLFHTPFHSMARGPHQTVPTLRQNSGNEA